MSENTTQVIPKEVATAATLLPYRRDDNRSKYLGYLCCGFSEEEALFVLGLNIPWLKMQRNDITFAELEEHGLVGIRKELSRDYTEMDFVRNFRMILEKDHRVIRKSLGMELEPDEDGQLVPAELTPYEFQYLIKLRGAYTPQQLQLLESVVSAGNDNFNFAKWVENNKETIELSRTQTIKATRTIDA